MQMRLCYADPEIQIRFLPVEYRYELTYLLKVKQLNLDEQLNCLSTQILSYCSELFYKIFIVMYHLKFQIKILNRTFPYDNQHRRAWLINHFLQQANFR